MQCFLNLYTGRHGENNGNVKCFTLTCDGCIVFSSEPFVYGPFIHSHPSLSPSVSLSLSLSPTLSPSLPGIIKETDIYGGDSLLSNQEELANIRREMEGWTDNALKVFSRHRGNSTKTHPDQEAMMAMNEVHQKRLKIIAVFKRDVT